MFYGLALGVSLFVFFKKARLLIYKLRKRSSAMMGLFYSDVEERLDLHRQRMTKALLYLLVSSCEVQRPISQPVPIATAYKCAAATGADSKCQQMCGDTSFDRTFPTRC